MFPSMPFTESMTCYPVFTALIATDLELLTCFQTLLFIVVIGRLFTFSNDVTVKCLIQDSHTSVIEYKYTPW